MNKVGLYTDGSGQLCIVHPSPGIIEGLRVTDSSDEQIQKIVTDLSVDPAFRDSVVWASKAHVYAQPRPLRNAWKHVDGVVSTDMVKAREIKMQMIRVARDAKLVELDATSLRAVEDGDVSEQALIKVQKQALRDLPATVALDSFDDPQALLDFTPPELV